MTFDFELYRDKNQWQHQYFYVPKHKCVLVIPNGTDEEVPRLISYGGSFGSKGADPDYWRPVETEDEFAYFMRLWITAKPNGA